MKGSDPTNAMRQARWREGQRSAGLVMFQAWVAPDQLNRLQEALSWPDHAWPVDGVQRLSTTMERSRSKTVAAERQRRARAKKTHAHGLVQFQAWVTPDVHALLKRIVESLKG